jgi:hypothetical protein
MAARHGQSHHRRLAAVLMEFWGSAENLARTCHAHPTLNGGGQRSALAVDKRPIHRCVHPQDEELRGFSSTEATCA